MTLDINLNVTAEQYNTKISGLAIQSLGEWKTKLFQLIKEMKSRKDIHKTDFADVKY